MHREKYLKLNVWDEDKKTSFIMIIRQADFISAYQDTDGRVVVQAWSHENTDEDTRSQIVELPTENTALYIWRQLTDDMFPDLKSP